MYCYTFETDSMNKYMIITLYKQCNKNILFFTIIYHNLKEIIINILYVS